MSTLTPFDVETRLRMMDRRQRRTTALAGFLAAIVVAWFSRPEPS